MVLFSARGLLVVLVSLLARLGPSFAEHTLVGTAPVITSQQVDVVVSSEFFINDTSANLVLSCMATGDPTPTIAWFMEGSPVPAEFVMSDGRLVRNVTDGDGASQDGTIYYCTATNSIGPDQSLPATVRSQDIIVTYTFFNGFRNSEIRTEQVLTVLGGPVALECDFLDASPRPEIQWFMNNGSSPIVAEPTGSQRLFLEEGRFLFILALTSAQRGAFFHCEVANAFLNNPQRSPTTYTLDGEIANNTLMTYIRDKTVTAVLGGSANLVLATASRRSNGVGGSATLTSGCTPPIADAGVTLNVVDSVMGVFGFADVPENTRQLSFTCELALVGLSIDPIPTVTYSFNFVQPASITAPDEGAESLIDRERLVGGGQVEFLCENQGFPAPEVTWYFNGEDTQSASGVSVNGNLLVISEPKVSNSGVYQCVVRNEIDGVVMEDRREWVLEVREPITPMVTDLTTTNPMAVSDRLEGTVIVADSGTANVTITVEVASDPCPTVQWRFNNTLDISGDSQDYSINDPCGVGTSPFTFTLIIANLTSATSGPYSAEFSHLADSTPLPGLFVTVPVPVKAEGLMLSVEGADFQCFFQGRNVILTCALSGFPRPGIVFNKGGVNILPGMPGFERITNINSDQIRIDDVNESDAVMYSCETTLTGNAMSRTLDPIFCTPPSIANTMVIPSREQRPVIPVGGELELQCDPDGTPNPMVKWMKDGDLITETLADEMGVSISTSIAGVSELRFESVSVEDNGDYTCIAMNEAGTAQFTFTVDQIMVINEPVLSTAAIIGIAAGGVGFFLLVVLLILLLVCVYLCARRGKSGSTDFAYNVDYSTKPADFGDGRGNVDTDSFDGGQPEAFDPDYDSVPTRRPNEPPPYKITPSYQHGAPLAGEDVEMIKYPPQDDFVATGAPPYSRPGNDNGYRQPPNADDFLSEDAQFV